MLLFALTFLLSYLLGSLVMGVFYSRWRGEDIRGRDLPGGSGTYRQYGKAAGVGVALADMLKGAAAVALAHWLAPEATWLATLGVVLGHCYPVFFGFRGGGGIAPLIGAMLAAAPKTMLGILALALLLMPLYRLTLQKRVGMNVIPFVSAVVVPFGLWLGWRWGGFFDFLAGSLVMLVRGLHMLMQDKRAAQRGAQG
ncbi:MAG: glycerol-3-phosphate acyltransferase [Deinococcus sp.]|uniref:glycerol-3-phosphate acyltransferase n=1 Tax=Deinococcus sp. TaxID=47478 RepID=UPI0026DB3D78|nr:glycerol-3-phosphate acyltransferase [Deinococcus sp.]MDO4246945.1 glycerol-3-phosphate acyltransferase [Deinococcus sp.]